MAEGALDCEIAAKWDISRDTFYRWKREYPEFKEAHEKGLVKCEAWWLKNARAMLSGELTGKHSFNAFIAIVNNKFGWKDKESVVTNNQINISNINVLQTKSPTELLEFIHDKIEETGIIEIDEQHFELIEQEPSTTSGNSGSFEDIS